MRVSEVLSITQGQIFTTKSTREPSQADLDREIRVGGSADLMSDVLYFDMSQGLLVTGLINPQTVRTAEMADIVAVLIVRAKTPPPETINTAWEANIPIMGTEMTMFEACGRLYAAGLLPAQPSS